MILHGTTDTTKWYNFQTKGHFFSEEIVSDAKLFLDVFTLYIFQMHFNFFLYCQQHNYLNPSNLILLTTFIKYSVLNTVLFPSGQPLHFQLLQDVMPNVIIIYFKLKFFPPLSMFWVRQWSSHEPEPRTQWGLERYLLFTWSWCLVVSSELQGALTFSCCYRLWLYLLVYFPV